jgi:hypothetical protein
VLLRPFLNDVGSCASYLFGCTSHAKLAVVDPHADFVAEVQQVRPRPRDAVARRVSEGSGGRYGKP